MRVCLFMSPVVLDSSGGDGSALLLCLFDGGGGVFRGEVFCLLGSWGRSVLTGGEIERERSRDALSIVNSNTLR